MSKSLSLLRKWNECYRVLHYRNGFSLAESVRYGLWLARAESTVDEVTARSSDGKVRPTFTRGSATPTGRDSEAAPA